MEREAPADGVEIRPAHPDDRAEWDAIARSSEDAWLGHTWDWARLVEEGVWGGLPRGLVIRRHGRTVGIVPLHLTERRLGPLRRRVLHSDRWGMGGIALAPGLSDPERQALNARGVEAIHAVARAGGADKLLVSFPPLSTRNLTRGDRSDALLAAYGLERDRSTRSLVLRLGARDDADLWSGLEGRCRTAIRKAERSGVTVSAMEDRALVADHYYALHVATYRRTGARPHPRRYFDTILGTEWSTVFFAERDGRTIGAVNVGTFAGRAVYWTGASLEEAGDLGANNLLQWRAIQWLRDSGHTAYELGELPAEGVAERDDPKLHALARFKRSFGAEPVPFVRGEHVYRPLRERVAVALRGLGLRA